jgi:polyvinyl alcohol dehydrogenase (cytochrome)
MGRLRLLASMALVAAAVPVQAVVGSSQALARTQAVTVAGTTYVPPVTVASTGESVTVHNADPIPHSLTSDMASAGGTPLFDSGAVASGQTVDVRGVGALAPGTYQYHCVFHPWMHGVLEVTGTTSASGNVEWPTYGADLANSRTVAGGPSATQVPTLEQAWRADFTDGDFTGTPVVSGGVAYVGSNGGKVRAIQAVASATHAAGSVLWTTSTSDGSSSGDPVNASLAVSGGTVYVPVAKLGRPYVLALNAATGSILWHATLETSTDADVYGSPTVAPTATGGFLVLQGVSAVSGDPASPLRGSVSAFDTATGALVWKTYAAPPADNGGAVWSTPAVDTATHTVYVGTGNAYTGAAAPTTDAILALDLATGAIKGSFQATSGDDFSSSTPGLDFDFGASPNLIDAGTTHLVGEGQKGGAYWAVDRATMKPAWHTQVGPGSVVGGVLGSTAYDAAAQQIVGPISLPGYIWSLDTAGLPKWLTAAAADPVHLSPVAISNGVVYSVATGGFLEAWLEQTGTPLGEFPLNDLSAAITNGKPSYAAALASGVAVADGLVVADVGSQGSNGSVVAFSVG